MTSFKKWLEASLVYSLIPPNIPRTQTGVIGNELRTDAGKTSRARSGETERRYNSYQSKSNFKDTITELPVPRSNKPESGLGNLGMEIVGKTTFGDQ